MENNVLWRGIWQRAKQFYNAPLFTLYHPFKFHPSRLLAAVTIAVSGSAIFVGVSQVGNHSVPSNQPVLPAHNSAHTLGAEQTQPVVAPDQASTSNPANGADTGGQSGNAAGTNVQFSSNNTNGSVSSSLTVNGQNIAVPQNGTISKSVSTQNGTTSINVSHTSTGTSSNSSSTNVDINVQGNDSAAEEGAP